ncbi:hypothetical protein [Acidocella sp.]|uniref:hypothetical protein n=1 Tax=Acidocella sp. TaxID=50710 RepID=UPI002611FCE1|nr:hypothetical protein [Acidocella sp.]
MARLSSSESAQGAWLLPVALALGGLFAAAWLQLRPPAQGPLALVFPPWWSGTRAMLAAAPAGAILRFGAWPSIVIIAPAPGVAAMSPAATGAWLILDPRQLGICGGGNPLEHSHDL